MQMNDASPGQSAYRHATYDRAAGILKNESAALRESTQAISVDHSRKNATTIAAARNGPVQPRKKREVECRFVMRAGDTPDSSLRETPTRLRNIREKDQLAATIPPASRCRALAG